MEYVGFCAAQPSKIVNFMTSRGHNGFVNLLYVNMIIWTEKGLNASVATLGSLAAPRCNPRQTIPSHTSLRR
jgi:hypothetical protein